MATNCAAETGEGAGADQRSLHSKPESGVPSLVPRSVGTCSEYPVGVRHRQRVTPMQYRTYEWLARGGYAAHGCVYVIMGGLAVLAALRSWGPNHRGQGALLTLLSQPFGFALLGMVAWPALLSGLENGAIDSQLGSAGESSQSSRAPYRLRSERSDARRARFLRHFRHLRGKDSPGQRRPICSRLDSILARSTIR